MRHNGLTEFTQRFFELPDDFFRTLLRFTDWPSRENTLRTGFADGLGLVYHGRLLVQQFESPLCAGTAHLLRELVELLSHSKNEL